MSECQHRGLGIENCISGTDEAGVICTGKCFSLCYLATCLTRGFITVGLDMTCEDGAVHLVGGDTLSRGRVEYCYHGSWYSLCANDWGEQEARVVCNTLGYDTTGHGKIHDHSTESEYELIIVIHLSVSVVSNFGRGTSPILNKNFQCSSGYNVLSQCTITEQNTSQCQHVAGVICEGLHFSSLLQNE